MRRLLGVCAGLAVGTALPGIGPRAALAIPANVAVGRPVMQSSTIAGGVASRAVDGNGDGNWAGGSVTHTDLDTTAWWEVDLGSVVPIETITLRPRTDCCTERLRNFYVLVSEAPFASADLAATLADPNVWHTFITGPVATTLSLPVARSGGHVRIQLGGSDYLSLAEVEIYADLAPPTPTRTNTAPPTATATVANTATPSRTPTATALSGGNPNLALGRLATQSSTVAGGGALRAVDGNTDGAWGNNSVTHTGFDLTAWWQVSLGGVYAISHVAVWNRTDCCGERLRDFYVLVADVPFTSTNLATTLAQPGVSAFFHAGIAGVPAVIPINRTAGHVRIQLTGQDYLSLAEVQVRESSGGGPSPTSSPVATSSPTPLLSTPTRTSTSILSATPAHTQSATPTATPPTDPNLALGRPAIQSSTVAGGAAMRAVDGNPDGLWSSLSVTHTDLDLNAWWEVDLGAVRNIGRVDVWNRTDCCGERLSSFYVLVSDLPFASSDLFTTLVQAGVSAFLHAGPAGTPSGIAVNRTGRHVRVQLAGQDYLSLAEVQVWDASAGAPTATATSPPASATPTVTQAAPVTPTSTETAAPTVTPFDVSDPNLSRGRVATQSSTAFGGVATRAVDGNTDGNWGNGSVTHTDLDVTPWWQVDLGAVQPISMVDVWPRTDCCTDRLRDFYVFVSDVPFAGDDVATTLSQLGVSAFLTAGITDIPTRVGVHRSGRYVRVQLTATDFLSLAEVIVWHASAGVPTPTPSPSATSSPSGTFTAPPTVTPGGPSPTRSGTPTRTLIPTRTTTGTRTATGTRTGTRTTSATRTRTATATPSATRSPTTPGAPTATRTLIPTRTLTHTITPIPSRTPSNTRPPTATRTDTVTRTPTRTRTVTRTRTITPTRTWTPATPVGPVISHASLVRPDGCMIGCFNGVFCSCPLATPTAHIENGVRVFPAQGGGRGMIVVEARQGINRRNPGRTLFVADPCSGRPSLEIESNRPLGLGLPFDCNDPFAEICEGGVPPVPFAPDFGEDVISTINKFTCHFQPTVVDPRDACTINSSGNFGFLGGFSGTQGSTQYCYNMGVDTAFPVGDTDLYMRVLDTDGNPGPTAVIRVRVPTPEP